MGTWKRVDASGETHFQFLCSSCESKKRLLLEQNGWLFIRENEPATCNDCELHCALTARQLWGAADEERYRICGQCSNYDACSLKGRYYC